MDDDKQSGLGLIFLHSLEESLQRIQHHPQSYNKRYRNLRLDKMHRFPYLVIFKVEMNTITVVKVVHGKRHPKIWKSLSE